MIWVVDGGIAYDDFNNGIKIRAAKVQLLEDYRFAHARALHIKLNDIQSNKNVATKVETLISDLDGYRSQNAMPVVFHLQYEDYLYELKTNGQWSVMPSEQCLLALEKCLDKDDFYLEYQ